MLTFGVRDKQGELMGATISIAKPGTFPPLPQGKYKGFDPPPDVEALADYVCAIDGFTQDGVPVPATRAIALGIFTVAPYVRLQVENALRDLSIVSGEY